MFIKNNIKQVFNMEKTIPSAADTLKSKFLSIADDVIPADKKDLIEKEGYSMTTVNMYLKGDILNIQTAITIYSFLKEKVEARRKIIAQL